MGRPWYNVVVLALAIGYFFVVAALAGLSVGLAYRLHMQFRQAWLLPFTFYLASWGALALLQVAQHMLIGAILPQAAWDQVQTSTRPLLVIAFAVSLYFLSSFMAQLTGGQLSRGYTIGYVIAWAALGIGISVGGAIVGNDFGAARVAARLATFVLRAGTMYGWIVYGLLAIRHIEDPLERTGLRRFVLLLFGGFLAFDLAMRDVTGVRTPDTVLGMVNVGLNYPPLLWIGRFLRRRALVRPPEPLPENLKSELVALGLSPRESDVVELLLLGLSHKEIGDRLCISPDTVKKHTYNAHRKLGVQNRVQLSYFVQNRARRRN